MVLLASVMVLLAAVMVLLAPVMVKRMICLVFFEEGVAASVAPSCYLALTG